MQKNYRYMVWILHEKWAVHGDLLQRLQVRKEDQEGTLEWGDLTDTPPSGDRGQHGQ